MRISAEGPVLVLGGAGFIGCNLVSRLVEQGKRVRILDNLSRPGVERNLAWLTERYPDALDVRIADLRDKEVLRSAVSDAVAVYHLAAQVAVTTSLTDPRHDLEVNLLGTFELLEALRRRSDPPPLLFTSTNKVYGALETLDLVEGESRWWPAKEEETRGVNERQPLAFCSPYGCSKGSADQYVLDYANTFGLPAAVFRMSCIYGPHQQGTEDQGWVMHFLRSAIEGAPITIYGDGKQVRDVLRVEDLVDALLLAWQHMDTLSGKAFNIGGGPSNAVSLIEVLTCIERLCERRLNLSFAPWRASDQKYYVSDPAAFQRATGWTPRLGASGGIEDLYRWVTRQHRPQPSGNTALGQGRPPATALSGNPIH